MAEGYVCKLAEGKVTLPSANLHKNFSRDKARHGSRRRGGAGGGGRGARGVVGRLGREEQ